MMARRPVAEAITAAPSAAPSTPGPDGSRIDWRGVIASGGRWSALVQAGSSPDAVSRRAGGLVHLAAPYLAEAQLRNQWRVERSVRAAMMAAIEVARLAEAGCTAVSPAIVIAEIGHARAVLRDAPDPLDLAFWAAWSQPILNVASIVVVPAIDGWDRCPLVWRDVVFALARNVPVHLYARGL